MSARIMIVEDNTLVAEDCRECLENSGFSVTSISASGEEAIVKSAEERPDAVLMDIKLRGKMDGIEAAAQIHDRFDIPVVFLSAFSDRDLLQRAKETGSFGYLVKPFDDRELFAMLEMTLYKAKVEKERRQMEARMQEMRKMKAIGRLAGGIAHELNNMLSVILGFTQSAMEEAAPGEAIHQDLQEVLTAARRSSELVRQLLTFAKKQIIAPKVLNLNDTIESRLSRLRRLIGEKIDLIWTPAEKLWPVKMDPTQLDQILADLCNNAEEAISVTGRITIQTGMASFDKAYCAAHEKFTSGDFVLLTISDDGRGMDKETLTKLFEPFFTTKALGKGTGLGLATIYGIIQQNKGFIDVHSTPGRGSTFNLYLPRYLPETDQASMPEASEKYETEENRTSLATED